MKSCLLFCALAFVTPIAHSAGAADRPRGTPPHFCPLFVIDYYPPDALYYCDYFETTCGELTGVDYWLGDLPTVPYVNCPGDCDPDFVAAGQSKAGVAAKGRAAAQRPVFPGIPNKVPLNYMHDVGIEQKAPMGKTGQGAPAASPGTVVNKQRDCHFVKATHGGRTIYAKVIEFQFNRPVAEGRQAPNDADALPHWQSKFVAYETDDPAESGYDVQQVVDPRPIDDHVWRGRISHEIGKSAPVLILLAK